MNEHLRPLTLAEILDRTAQLYRRNFWVFAGVGALPVGVMVAIAMVGGFGAGVVAVVAKGAAPPGAAVGLGAGVLVLMAVVGLAAYIAAGVFSLAGLTQAAVSAHRGERPTIRAALRSVGPGFWRYLWLLILQCVFAGLIPGAIAAAVAMPLFYLVARGGEGIAAGAALGLVAFVVIAAAVGVMIWLALSYSMGLVACVVEQKTAWESLQRSWKLSRGSRGRIFVLFLLVAALAMVLSMIAYIPFLIIVGVTAVAGKGAQNAAAALIAAELVNFLMQFVVQTLLAPVSWIALALFYFDQRIRTEGYDIEWMMERAGLTQLGSAAPPGAGGMNSGPVAPPDTAPPDTVEER
jgi:hypothetical protein